ncbi:MAG: DUF1643 domain-containing protein [Magnetococcales bacterium]|nr:DUF1643 domain-containing protein [Magnetococcales bacterium]
MIEKIGENRVALFSDCLRYRYTLKISWDNQKPLCNFLMLNPSTADEIKNDPTVERAERYARHWEYGALMVTNIFAFRATDPKEMKSVSDPVGVFNDQAIVESAQNARLTVCAWGNHGSHINRSKAVVNLLKTAGIDMRCLTLTKAGEPGHPLYLRKNLKPIIFEL